MFFNVCLKNCEKPLWVDMTILRGRECLVTKMNMGSSTEIATIK